MALLRECRYVTHEMQENVIKKVRYYESRVSPNKHGLKLVVFSDRASISRQMWNSLFNLDLVTYRFSKHYPLIPYPRPYDPAKYAPFIKELKNVILRIVLNKEPVIVWGVFNLAPKNAPPRINLALANRRLVNSEFGMWKTIDEKRSGDAEDEKQKDTSGSSVEPRSGSSADGARSSSCTAKSTGSSTVDKGSSSEYLSVDEFRSYSTSEDFQSLLPPTPETSSTKGSSARVLPKKKRDESGAGPSSQQ